MMFSKFTTVALVLVLAQAVKMPPPTPLIGHQAHSKPGGPYTAVDWDRNAQHLVTLDASQSHTHYFEHGPPHTSGKIIKYEWYSVLSSTKLIETTSPYLSATFFLGVTILKLVVTDSTNSTAEAYTYVTIRRPHLYENQPPSIFRIEPEFAPTLGGSLISVYGSSFYNNPRIIFNGKRITTQRISDKKLTFRLPPSDRAHTVFLRVTTGFGTAARRLAFHYRKYPGNPVRFRSNFVRSPDGNELNIPEITTLVLGPNSRYYAGSLNGYVHVLSIDRNLTVRSSCTSKNAGPNRSILGLAFHPNEYRPLRVYLTTSTLFWKSKNTTDSWDNGKIEVWSRQGNNDCLSRARMLITGLPVSGGDHGVNGLVFDSDGTLLVAVGGSTNAGVNTHQDKIGGIPESPLSGAVLRINTFDSSFDGTILYNGWMNPGTATVHAGSVEVFSSGLRNVYGIMRHSNGYFYAMDNGPNVGFGVAATSCNSTGAQASYQDKLLHIQKGAFYGHPNWNRGRFDKRQCKYVAGDVVNVSGYTAPLAILESSTNGIVEYTANTFNGKMRGHLILSRISWTGMGLLKMGRLNASGEGLIEEPYEIFNDSGLAVAMGPYGELLMPKMKQSKILGLVPDEEVEDGFHVIAVTPRRGPALGGNLVLVTGVGMETNVRIFFGGVECAWYGTVAADGSNIECEVPPYESGKRAVQVIMRKHGMQSKSWNSEDYEYMEI